MNAAWTKALVPVALAIGVGGLIGLLYGHPALGALLAVLGVLWWHLQHLMRLDSWLRTGEVDELPDGSGAWPGVFARIQYLRVKLRRRGKRYRRLLRELRNSTEAFPDGGVLLTDRNEILAFNSAAQALLGLRGRSDRGQRIDNLLRHPDFVAFLRSNTIGGSVEVPAGEGGDVWLACRLIPFGPDQRLLLLRDISQRVQGERVRQEFIANASHELRTPLTVIAGYLDAMTGDAGIPEGWRRPVLEMNQQSVRMQRLVEDLLQLSRLESTPPAGKETVVDMPVLIRSVCASAQALPGPKPAVTMSIECQLGLHGDESEIRSVLTNLLQNALRYTGPGGAVSVSWKVVDSRALLTVRDTGSGIAAEHIPRLTERFFRADPGRDRGSGGTGLAIVKHALRRHDAELDIRSQPGQGSEFTCIFPGTRLVPAPAVAGQ
jgi:two-component system, OmpR family, phosphate regulon sensor histidine kinase PhoR